MNENEFIGASFRLAPGRSGGCPSPTAGEARWISGEQRDGQRERFRPAADAPGRRRDPASPPDVSGRAEGRAGPCPGGTMGNPTEQRDTSKMEAARVTAEPVPPALMAREGARPRATEALRVRNASRREAGSAHSGAGDRQGFRALREASRGAKGPAETRWTATPMSVPCSSGVSPQCFPDLPATILQLCLSKKVLGRAGLCPMALSFLEKRSEPRGPPPEAPRQASA